MSLSVDKDGTHEGIARFLQLYDLNMKLSQAGIRKEYPHASPQEVRQKLAERIALIRKEKWKGYGPSDGKHR